MVPATNLSATIFGMVVQEDDVPMEASSSIRSNKYVVVKNHVRELLPEDEVSVLVNNDTKTVEKCKTVKTKDLKRKKGPQKQLPSVSEPTEISESDLKELKSVYSKCKAVLKKIESKYGHLLNLNDNKSIESCSNTTNEDASCDYCNCSQKKKIVFDENGQRIEKDCIDNHICIKRIKRTHTDVQPYKPSVQIEHDYTPNLPNNLQELEKILKDTNINKNYRRMVIDKVYLLRQEYLNEVRFEKHLIVKQLKENPDEVLDFKGTNLSTLHGYPIQPKEKRQDSNP